MIGQERKKEDKKKYYSLESHNFFPETLQKIVRGKKILSLSSFSLFF